MKTKLASIFLLGIILGLASCRGNSTKTSATTDLSVNSDSILDSYREKGNAIVANSFQALKSELMQAMQAGGPTNALKYCNVQATPLIDSLMEAYNVDIKRVTLKARNKLNEADSIESNYLIMYENELKAKGSVNDTIFIDENQHYVYLSPIVMLAQCLQCHGNQGVEVSEETAATINALYPDDKAMGYALGDLRGMWRIRFNK